MPLNVTFPSFTPGTTIYSAEVNTNNQDIENWANAHEVLTTGIHGVGAGVIVGTRNNNTFTALNSFDNALSIRSPNYISNAIISSVAGIARLMTEAAIVPTTPAPVYIRNLDSNGRWVTRTFSTTAYCTIQDATSADSYFYNGVAGTPWGTTSGVAWANRMPLFIYIATDGVNPCLFFARKPNLRQLPVAAEIGYANNPPATPAETNVFAWTTNNVTVSHAQTNATLIGYLEATKDVNDDWTFYPLSDRTGGIQNFGFEAQPYLMPTNQNGSAAGSYFSVAAGTAPTYGTSNIAYKINREGRVTLGFYFQNGAGNTPGAGAASLVLALPYLPDLATTNVRLFSGNGTGQNPVAFPPMIITTNATGATFEYGYPTALGVGNSTTRTLQGLDQSNVIRGLRGTIIYYT